MLFVDHDQTEPGEIDRFGEECLRADGERGFARRQSLVRGAPLARPHRAEHRFDRDAEGQQQRCQLLRVLRGQDLGRRHQRAL